MGFKQKTISRSLQFLIMFNEGDTFDLVELIK